jgi:predicted PurR-regulated permease PerM
VPRESLFAAFFFAVFLFLLHELYLFVVPFLRPLGAAAILALTFYPATAWLTRRFRGSRGLAALVLLLVVTAGAIMPSIYLGSVMVQQASTAYGRVQEAATTGEFDQWRAQLEQSTPGRLWTRVAGPFLAVVPLDPKDLLLKASNWVTQEFVGGTTALARNILVTVFNFMLMLVALFFFFRDGEHMAHGIRELLPMEPAHKEAIFQRLYDTLSAVVQSMVATAVTQGLLAGIGYWLIADLTFSAFLGYLTGLAAFLPLAGPALVWSGVVVWLWIVGASGRALGMLLWGVLVVSAVDNLIKPLIIGGRANLPTFPLLIALLGGISVYGMLGVFVGPVLLAILFSFIQIYQEQYQRPAAVIDETAVP